MAVAAVILVLIDISDGLLPWQQTLDNIILGIFTIDYAARFYSAPNKKWFVRHNVCDLIAILPFHTLFRAFKIAKLGRFLKLTKIPRMFAFLYRPLKKSKVFFNTNGFKYVVFVTALLIAVGGILIHFAEDMPLADGIWWAFVTATTVGYGDISPHTFYGRIIAMVLMLVGIGLIGTVTSTITSYFLNASKKESLSNETLNIIRERLDNFENLTNDDIDTICKLLKTLKK